MEEYGSDFHVVDNFFIEEGWAFMDIYKDASFYASGRQPIIDLIRCNNWHCIWIPRYFCYEVVDTILKTGIEIAFYDDFPLADDNDIIKKIPFEKNDVLLRVNYFGLRSFRDNEHVPVPVIEDHSHDLLGCWALHSNADWCIASIRKTLPLAEGGMLWSPKHHELFKIQANTENERIARYRWNAMEMKQKYLQGKTIDKDVFRKIYIETEELFNSLPICALSVIDMKYLINFDVNYWYNLKQTNWFNLKNVICKDMEVLLPEESHCNVFSLSILLKDAITRDSIRGKMIAKKIYPAILWDVPGNKNKSIIDFSECMLSIHCDGRYTKKNIDDMGNIILSICEDDTVN